MTAENLDKIGRLLDKRDIWINLEYFRDGKLAKKEFFLRKVEDKFKIGFDDYLDAYEDATDLYFSYIREEFNDLKSAILFAVESLAIEMRDLLKN